MKLTAESTAINDSKLNTNINNAQTSADNAQSTANTAVTKADNAQSTANQAKTVADNTAQYFWTTSSGSDTGAHISEKTQAQFEANPSGGNLLARSNGIAVRDGLTELATFGASEARIGENSDRHVSIKTDGLQVYQNASTAMAHIGYGSGASESGTTTAPYYTFGNRGSGAVGNYSLAQGIGNIASAPMSHAEGKNTTASGNMSHAEGAGTVASSYEAHAEGHNTTASAQMAHAEGESTTASKDYAHAEGNGTTASGIASHAEGNNTTASGNYSHAEGESTTASGNYSHAEGRETKAVGTYAHAEGYLTEANIGYSHASGWRTIANGEAQTAIGKFNVADTTSLFIVGKGTASTARSNAFAIDRNGNATLAGTLTQGSDRRLKEHLAYLGEEAIDFIDSLKPAYYIKDGEHHVGFYAQDVEEADKWQCMVGEMNGYKTLCYIELIAPLVAYVQKLEKRIEELERGK